MLIFNRYTVNYTFDNIGLTVTFLVPFFKYVIWNTICLEILGD